MHTMQLLPGVAIQPNLELKTQPKQLLVSLPLVIALPGMVLADSSTIMRTIETSKRCHWSASMRTKWLCRLNGVQTKFLWTISTAPLKDAPRQTMLERLPGTDTLAYLARS